MRAMRPGPCAALRGVCVKGWLKALQKALTLGEAGVSAFSASVDPSVIVLAYSWSCWCGCPVPLFCATSCLECVGTQALSGTCALLCGCIDRKPGARRVDPARGRFPWAAHAPPSPAAGWSARSRCFASCHMATSSSVRDWRRSIMRLRWRVRAFRLADAAATSFFFSVVGPTTSSAIWSESKSKRRPMRGCRSRAVGPKTGALRSHRGKGALMAVLELRSRNLAPNVVQNLGPFSVTICVMAGLLFHHGGAGRSLTRST